MAPSLDIIIVNWNSGNHLRECLASIVSAEKSRFHLARVAVVDNASEDGSCDRLEPSDLPLTLIHNTENRGFAAACNHGANGSQADYLLFLNPDTQLFQETLDKPLEFMQRPENGHVGICGVRLIDDFNVTAISCARFPSLKIFFGKMTGLDRISPRLFPSHILSREECRQNSEVDQVIGAFFMVRKTLYDSNQGFDERFFVYFEEVDFAFRAKEKGYSSYYLADVSLYHKGGASSQKVKAKRLFYSLRSRIQYAFKHFSMLEATVLLLLTLTVELGARILRGLTTSPMATIGETLGGYSMLILFFIRKGWK